MRQFTLQIMACCLLMVAALVAIPQGAFAATCNSANSTSTNSGDTCTTFCERATEVFDNPNSTQQDGIMSDIYKFIVQTVNDATQKLFVSFTNSTEYQNALMGAMSLMVVLYGVGFTMGIVQPNFQQVLVRLIKMGILFTLISPTGWEFFNDNVVRFFQDGTDDLIRGVQAIGTGIPVPQGATPFYALDRLAEFIIQPDTIIGIMGSVLEGPFGLTMGALMLIAMIGFIQLVLKCLQVYAVTFVARALILGLAPIFFVFLLFDKTKMMFMGWLNAIVNLSLQPILLFTFLSFFLVLIESASRDMLGTELCWQEYKNVEGSPNKLAMWRHIDGNTKVASTEMTWKGSMECLLSPNSSGANAKPCPEFPINIVDILSFLILIYLAQRFTSVVERISSEISNAFVALDTQGKLSQMLEGNKSGGGGLLGGANPKAGGHSGRR